jgi:hypothetical protein
MPGWFNLCSGKRSSDLSLVICQLKYEHLGQSVDRLNARDPEGGAADDAGIRLRGGHGNSRILAKITESLLDGCADMCVMENGCRYMVARYHFLTFVSPFKPVAKNPKKSLEINQQDLSPNLLILDRV